jgi:hypothetical protein
MTISFVLFVSLWLFLQAASGANVPVQSNLHLPEDAPVVYGITTEATWTTTIVWMIRVDVTTGKCTNVTRAEVYGGSSATIDGISALDQNQGLYYWVTDYETPLVYMVDFSTGELEAPLDLYVEGINSLTVNPTTSELFVVAYQKQSNIPAIFGYTYPEGPVRVVKDFTGTTVKVVGTGAFDTDKNVFYLTTSNNTSVWQLGLLTVDPSSGKIISTKLIPNCLSYFPDKMFYDSDTKKIHAGALNVNTLKSSWLEIDPSTGNCQATAVQNPGIVTAWSWDSNSGNLYYSIAASSAMVSYINVATGKQGSLVQTYYLMESFEVYTGK